jgi:hypothetical protein
VKAVQADDSVLEHAKPIKPLKLLPTARDAKISEFDKLLIKGQQLEAEYAAKQAELDEKDKAKREGKGKDVLRMSDLPFRIGGSAPKIKNPVVPGVPNEMIKWMTRKHVGVRRLEGWRWLNSPLFGQINGLPTTRGRAMMANGIFVLIERQDGSVFWGHECHWIDDDSDGEERKARKEEAKRKVEEVRALRVAAVLAELAGK